MGTTRRIEVVHHLVFIFPLTAVISPNSDRKRPPPVAFHSPLNRPLGLEITRHGGPLPYSRCLGLGTQASSGRKGRDYVEEVSKRLHKRSRQVPAQTNEEIANIPAPRRDSSQAGRISANQE